MSEAIAFSAMLTVMLVLGVLLVWLSRTLTDYFDEIE